MKRFWIIVCTVGAMTAAQAQPTSERGGTPGERAEKLTARMAENLDLTEEQQAKVGEINLKYANETASLREETREQREETRASMKEIRQQQEAELKQVLTEEQRLKYEARRDERQDRRKRRRRGRQ